jgi:hypothetical protein
MVLTTRYREGLILFRCVTSSGVPQYASRVMSKSVSQGKQRPASMRFGIANGSFTTAAAGGVKSFAPRGAWPV